MFKTNEIAFSSILSPLYSSSFVFGPLEIISCCKNDFPSTKCGQTIDNIARLSKLNLVLTTNFKRLINFTLHSTR